MNELMVFSNDVFGKVRTEVVNGEVYFAGLDIANALGYKKPRNAVCRHCDGALKRGATDSRGRKATISFIPESDVYRLVTRSELPSAKEFERWIFEIVLPQIRQTGGFIPVDDINEDETVIMARAMEIMKRTLERKDKVILDQEATIKKLEDAIPMDCVMMARAQKTLKVKCTEIFGTKYWKNNPEYKILKNRVFSNFKVSTWHEIPANKFAEVMKFIEGMK